MPFKAYDIRGIYPDKVHAKLAYKVGRAFVQLLNAKTVVVGRDGRKSSPELFKELTRGIVEQGADVIDIGLTTTPLLNFSVAKYSYDAGIMISASHNPKEYNAFKLIKHPAIPVHGQDIQKIKSMTELAFSLPKEQGSMKEKKPLDDYCEHIKAKLKTIKDLKVVVDYGNGVGAITGKPLLDQLPIEVISLYEEVDGEFPNHPANPHDLENLQELQETVTREQADLGIFFDGDADRSFLVDEQGDIVMPDIMLALLAEEVLKDQPNQKIYFDLRSSKALKEHIEENHGIPVMLQVGCAAYKEALQKEGLLGGELSGHIMFKEHYGIDDGLFAALKIMELLCKQGKTLSELTGPLLRYHASPEINLKVADAEKTLQQIHEAYHDGKSTELDGVHITYENWWFSLRKSNTEPLVRLRLEANTKELLEKKQQELLEKINSF